MGEDASNVGAHERDAPADDITRSFGLGEGDDAWLDHVRSARRGGLDLGRIGPYELIEELGHGGQGTVYKARQPGTQRFVAIKRLAVDGLTGAERERLPREVDALTRLEHPNVLTVHAAEVIDGRAILVTQFVDGAPIDQWADEAARGRDWIARVLGVFIAVCDGVAHAHQRGVIHRDIKPGNIIVDKSDVPHVVDFGIARLLDEERTRESTQPTLGFAGTPSYAAPERLAGRPADTRGDIYSLGVLLYRLIAGANPFTDSAGLRQLIDAVGSGETSRPSAIRRGLPTDLDWIVLKAMAVDPERRYQSVNELRADVHRFVAGEAIEAHPPTVAYRLRTFVRRNRWPLAAAALIGAALITATIVSWRSAERADRALEVQTKLVAMMREVLRGGDTGSKEGRPDMTVREALDLASKRLLEDQKVDSPIVEAALRMAIAETYMHIGLIEPAEKHLNVALELQSATFGRLSDKTLEARHQLARIYRTLGRLEQAATMQRDLVAQRRMVGDKLLLAKSLTSLGITLRHLKAFDEAEAAQREALDLYSSALGPNNENVGQVSSSLSSLLGSMGRLDEAEEFSRRAVAIARHNHRDHPHHDLAAVIGNLGAVLLAREKLDEGEAALREALAMHRAVSGELHIRSAMAAGRLADHLVKRERWDEAVPLLQAALEAYQALQPEVTQPIESTRAALQAAQARLDEISAARGRQSLDTSPQ